jgi:4-carboxymuconolactone decarboxylase
LITLALLAALGQEYELAMHIHATLNTGVARRVEVFMQVAIYAGVPSANTAFCAKRVYAELDGKEVAVNN